MLWVQHLSIALDSTAQDLRSWVIFQALPYGSPLLSSLRSRQESTGSVPYLHSVTRSSSGLAIELAMAIPERKPGISWEADSLPLPLLSPAFRDAWVPSCEHL